MQCPTCGTDNRPDARFCDACGALVAGTAAGDGPLPQETRLHHALQRLVPKEYAQRLLASRDQVPGERRTVTILFADVTGSTALAENLDPEDVMDIMNGVFDLLVESITRYEGTLARLMGDGVLAFFGAPIAHEDDAQRAVLSGLAIVSGAQKYGEKLKADWGIEGFDVRVGIHTGLVVVGEVGSDLRVEYTAMGDAVNQAARLEQAAQPGTVLISQATHKHIAPLFDTEPLGPISMKGKAEPVRVHLVVAARHPRHKPRGIPGLESPLVGRGTELAALTQALDSVALGQGGLISIMGEAGIGKSRLIAEARRALAPGGEPPSLPETEDPSPRGRVYWVEGRCLSYGLSLAYLPWLDILRGLLGITLDDPPQAVASALQARVSTLCSDRIDTVYPYLARLMSLQLDAQTQEELDELDGRTLRGNTFAAFEVLLSCAAGRQPLVLVCEDLHWADSTSLDLLEHLLPLSHSLPILFLCLSRPVREHPWWERQQAIAAQASPSHKSLPLEALSASDSQSLVSNLLWVDELPAGLKDLILIRAEGNPFYLEEILRSLIDQAAIHQDETSGRWQAVKQIDQILIPETLTGVLVARIDRLQEETRRVLQLAAVIGRVFLYRILHAMAQAEQDLDGKLATLQQEQMIRERARLPELEYIFKHDLTREAAYNGLLKKDRRIFHHRVGEALEQIFPDRIEEILGLLAHHWERAKVSDKAIDYLSRAADQARLAYALTEAVGYYQRLLTLQKQAKQYRQAARTLMKLGLAHQNAFQFQRSQHAFQEGFALWQRSGRAGPAAPPPAPHPFRHTMVVPDTLDFWFGYSPLSSGLVGLARNHGIVPDIAHSWEMRDGGLTHVFYLRDDVRWSDGAPLTASDFEYTWKRKLDPAQPLHLSRLFYDIKGAQAFHQGVEVDPQAVGVTARGDLTLTIELERPIAYLLQLLGCGAARPRPRHVIEKWGTAWADPANIVTNGPFRLETFQAGQFVSLVRNPTYHGSVSGNVERVERTASDSMPNRDLVDMYEADALDFLYLGALDYPEMARAQRRNANDYLQMPVPGLFYAGFNVRQPPFDDSRVRRAFAQTVNRQDAVTDWFDNELTTGGMIPIGMPGHSPGLALPYDPDSAHQLLAQAGYPRGSGFPKVECLSLLYHAWDKAYRSILQPRWQDLIGAEIEWVHLDSWQQVRRRARKDRPYLFLRLWIADYPDPNDLMWVSFPWQLTGLTGGTYYNLVEEAGRTTDQAKRLELYTRADRLLVDEAVTIPFEYGGHWLLVKPWIREFGLASAGEFALKDIVIEPH